MSELAQDGADSASDTHTDRLSLHRMHPGLLIHHGGTISIDWAIADRNKDILNPSSLSIENSYHRDGRRKVCLVFPGLSGGSDRGYLKSLVKTLMSDGFEVAVFHNRGVGNTPYTSL